MSVHGHKGTRHKFHGQPIALTKGNYSIIITDASLEGRDFQNLQAICRHRTTSSVTERLRLWTDTKYFVDIMYDYQCQCRPHE